MAVLIRVGVDYGTDPDLVERLLVEEATQAVGTVPGLLAEPAPTARLIPTPRATRLLGKPPGTSHPTCTSRRVFATPTKINPAASARSSPAVIRAPVGIRPPSQMMTCAAPCAGGKILLNKTRLHLKRGRRYGLCGHNGAGKVRTNDSCC